MLLIQLFLFLQLLDVLTTMVGFRLGLSEASPFVRLLLSAGPTAGLLLSKCVALGLGAYCVQHGRLRLISWANYWYAALVTWNLCLILQTSLPAHV
jgi:hypothetical protein